MTLEMTNVAKVAATIPSLTLKTCSADVRICRGESSFITVSAQTPAFWSVQPDGAITEIGGPVAEAVNSGSAGGVSVNISKTSFLGTTFTSVTINNRSVSAPQPREQLVIDVPESFVGALIIDAQYFGTIVVDAALKGQLDATVAMRVSLKLADQPTLAGASLKASTGATISAGTIYGDRGNVTISADLSGSAITIGKIRARYFEAKAALGAHIKTDNIDCKGSAKLSADFCGSQLQLGHVSALDCVTRASSGGKITGKNFSVRDELEVKSDMSGSLVALADVWAQSLDLKSPMSGNITFARADVDIFDARADMGGTIRVSKGSANSGRVKADMGGVVNLSGEFGALKCKEDMGGRARVIIILGDAAERFSAAGKRNFNRDIWENSYVSIVALCCAHTLAPGLEANLAEALSDDTFVSLVSSAFRLSYKDASVLQAMRECAAAFSELLGPAEDLTELPSIESALQAPAVVETFGRTFQTFVAVTMDKAQFLAA